jgi:hypothetical protein
VGHPRNKNVNQNCIVFTYFCITNMSVHSMYKNCRTYTSVLRNTLTCHRISITLSMLYTSVLFCRFRRLHHSTRNRIPNMFSANFYLRLSSPCSATFAFDLETLCTTETSSADIGL